MKSAVYPHIETESSDYRILFDWGNDNWMNLLDVEALEVQLIDGSKRVVTNTIQLYLINPSEVAGAKAIRKP